MFLLNQKKSKKEVQIFVTTANHTWQHGNREVKSLTVQVKFLICDSLLSSVFLK